MNFHSKSNKVPYLTVKPKKFHIYNTEINGVYSKIVQNYINASKVVLYILFNCLKKSFKGYICIFKFLKIKKKTFQKYVTYFILKNNFVLQKKTML